MRSNGDGISTRTLTESLSDVYVRLYGAFGPRNWWPAETPFEVMVGAILTQNTAWRNVERAISRLKDSGRFTPKGLLDMPESKLEECLRPSGTFRVKARRLRAFLRYYEERFGSSLESMKREPVLQLREELLSISGIGPETADCILLYGMGHPVFVVDAYTRRIFGRLGRFDSALPYAEVQARFQRELMPDASMYNEYHALIVHLGQTTCRPNPRCEVCPLLEMCEEAEERGKESGLLTA